LPIGIEALRIVFLNGESILKSGYAMRFEKERPSQFLFGGDDEDECAIRMPKCVLVGAAKRQIAKAKDLGDWGSIVLRDKDNNPANDRAAIIDLGSPVSFTLGDISK
jgi:hypothetical protein